MQRIDPAPEWKPSMLARLILAAIAGGTATVTIPKLEAQTARLTGMAAAILAHQHGYRLRWAIDPPDPFTRLSPCTLTATAEPAEVGQP